MFRDSSSGVSLNFENANKRDADFSKNCSCVAEALKERTVTLIEVVEELGCLLRNTVAEKREVGTLILTMVLQELPDDYFAPEDLKFVCTFYADRLKDNHIVIPAVLRGILALSKYANFPDGSAAELLLSMFNNIACQQQQQEDRNTMYRIFKTFFKKKTQELKSMNLQFVYGVITAIDGERDPKNLIFLFEWLPTFCRECEYTSLTEDVFEIMACYFPVDFKVPSATSNAVSRDSLAMGLCTCLCSTPIFGEFCLPLAVEKLSSSLRIAKLDSLDLLNEGCKTFNPNLYAEYFTAIWTQIQQDIFNNTINDSELEAKCLQTLVAVITKLPENKLKFMLSNIVDTLIGNLSTSSKFLTQTRKLLYHCAISSQGACDYVVERIAPTLFAMNDHSCLVLFTKPYIKFHGELTGRLGVVPIMCLDAAFNDTEDSTKIAALSGLSQLSEWLPQEIRNEFYRNAAVCLITSQSMPVQKALISCYQAFAKKYVTEVKADIIDKLQFKTDSSARWYLEALAAVATLDGYIETVLPLIIELCLNDYTEITQLALENLSSLVVANESNESFISYIVHEANLINKLTNHCINSSSNLQVVETISVILKTLVGSLSKELQCILVLRNIEPVIDEYRSTKNASLVIVISALMLNLHPDVLNDCQQDLVGDLLNFDRECDQCVRETATQLLANIMNKSVDVTSQLYEISNKMQLFNDEENQVRVCVWVTKALLMRCHVETDKWISKLFELLDKYQAAAKGFQIIMSENYDSLSKKSYCNERLLYRQKFFVESINNLKENKRNHLIAFGYLLQEASEQFFELHASKIIPLLLIFLDTISEPELLDSVLNMLSKGISNMKAIFEEHLPEFLPRLLQLTRFKPSMRVRIKALLCLQSYTTGYTLYKLLPHKHDVMIDLMKCLDDTKRLVRKQAVETRLKWYFLDAAE